MLQIGQNLKKIRHLTGLTQTEFAEKFGASINQQKSYELNKAKPGIAYMERLAELTGETIGNLLNIDIPVKKLKLNVKGSVLDENYKVDKVDLVEEPTNLSFPGYSKSPDYKEKYIQLLEKQVDVLENKVLASLNSLSVNVTQGRAEVRGSIEYEAIKDAKGDLKKKEAIMVEINKLINLNLPVTQELGSQVSSGR